MIRAAAKNHSGVAVVVKPEAYDAVLEELRESGGEISTETRQWLANEAFAHTAAYDAAISRWFGSRYETFPDHFVMSHEKFMELPYGENPHQKAALYIESGAGNHHVLARVVQAPRQAALVQQHPRPRRRLAAARRVLRARLRDRQAQQPLRDGDRRDRQRGVRARLRVRPALGVRRRAALQPADRRGAGRAPQPAVHRGAARARLRGGRDGGAHAEGVDPDPRGGRPGLHAARARRQAGARRAAGAGTRPDRRDARGDDGADRGPADRGAVGRPAVRLEGLPARALERDRVRQGRGDDRDRRRADEPGRLGADRDRQGARGVRRQGAGAARRLGGRLRRLLSLPGRPARRRCAPGRRRSSSPADRSATPRWSPPATRPARRWCSPAAATSATDGAGLAPGARDPARAAGLLRARRLGRQPARRLPRRRRGAGGRAPGRRARPRLRRDRVRRGPGARRAAHLHAGGRAAAGRASAGRYRVAAARAGARGDGAAPARGRMRGGVRRRARVDLREPRVGAAVRVRRARLAGRRGRARRARRTATGRSARLGLDRRARRA